MKPLFFGKLRQLFNVFFKLLLLMNSNKKSIIAIIATVAFMFFVFQLLPFFGLTEHEESCPWAPDADAECPHQQQLAFLESALPLLITIGVIVGAGVYYLMSSRIESKQKSLKKNANILLKFLNHDERKLVDLLIENNGKILQAEVTRLPEMTKVKSHRIVQRLLDRNVIESEKIGKTNVIRFSKEIKEGLLE